MKGVGFLVKVEGKAVVGMLMAVDTPCAVLDGEVVEIAVTVLDAVLVMVTIVEDLVDVVTGSVSYTHLTLPTICSV